MGRRRRKTRNIFFFRTTFFFRTKLFFGTKFFFGTTFFFRDQHFFQEQNSFSGPNFFPDQILISKYELVQKRVESCAGPHLKKQTFIQGWFLSICAFNESSLLYVLSQQLHEWIFNLCTPSSCLLRLPLSGNVFRHFKHL